MNTHTTTTAPDLDADIAEWFDAVLDQSWERRDFDGWVSSEAWFTMGTAHRPQVRIVVAADDEMITVHEFDDHACVRMTTRFSGVLTEQAPRVLRLLGIDA